jgi:hypothetical protein
MGRYAVHKNHNSGLPNSGVIALCLFLLFEVVRDITRKFWNYCTLNFFGVLTLKLKEVYFPVSKTYSGSITRLKPGSCLTLFFISNIPNGRKKCVIIVGIYLLNNAKFNSKYDTRNNYTIKVFYILQDQPIFV